jgi:UDP-glucose 4-epimerase
MKALVTGASGFLGRRVVARLLERGHDVRALVRPTSPPADWTRGVEVVRGDLRVSGGLVALFDGVDVVIHLAAAVAGDEDTQFASTVTGTERLLDAMAFSRVKRLVLVSSLVVYDWSRAHGRLDEATPLAADIYRMGAYDIAKSWQERVVRRMAESHGWQLTVMRPGFVWGRGRDVIAGMGRIVGRIYLMIGPATRLPLTYVDNCADCLVAAAESQAAIGQAFNVVDGDDVRVWRYARAHARLSGRRGLPLPVPYLFGLGLAKLAAATSAALFGARGRLPSLLTPRRFEAQFKPLRFSSRKLREVLGWEPPVPFEECLRRTYGSS